MPTPIPRESIAAGLRRLADLVDAGLLDEREYPETPEEFVANLVTPSAVARFAQTLGVETHSHLTVDGDALIIRATANLDGVTVEAFTLVPIADLDAAMAGDLLHRTAVTA